MDPVRWPWPGVFPGINRASGMGWKAGFWDGLELEDGRTAMQPNGCGFCPIFEGVFIFAGVQSAGGVRVNYFGCVKCNDVCQTLTEAFRRGRRGLDEDGGV